MWVLVLVYIYIYIICICIYIYMCFYCVFSIYISIHIFIYIIYVYIYIRLDEFSLKNACNLHSVILICDQNWSKPGIIQPDVAHSAGDPDILCVCGCVSGRLVELPKAGAELVIVTWFCVSKLYHSPIWNCQSVILLVHVAIFTFTLYTVHVHYIQHIIRFHFA